ncbi:EndoU domain-containing protein [Paenibacillus polymyxa]|uniref:EndoU domain-containing protein n=1 Tax=Paenibacillus polymyxa TaxID=1406 RepID=UPI000D913ABE|nr:EndoU domain-containing protein [Paenibacillus polymyxa]MDU8672387.1 EndoU domain-containing protein [Paenibacillus polymyxa]MDU8697295.1 EndoU domain-containing protein [Paenibacillus polymyxa]URJ70979.1 EndoU domain-containing protein [Paenibacillus polymyxa]WDZ61479.1 EndoU domain-containing protein [Paenibacillus polymyxa]WEC95144.1 EndoU domain-containing protein [Paenibacillus polymyxa]
MSVLLDGIGYESLRFYGPFQPLHIEQLQITRAINDHAYLHISGLLSEEQGAACIGQNMDQEPIVIRQLNDQGQSLRRLFHGIVTRMSVHCVRGLYTFELEAASHSYQMDIKRKRRSYQDTHRTYDDLVTALVRKYQYGDAIDTVSNHAKLETFVLQYEETDWAFLKRLASRFGSVLVPEVTAASPKVFFGMPEGKQHKIERDVFYRVRKTFHELDAEKPGERAGSYITYMIESLQYYALGDLITLPIGQGKELVVVRAVTTLTDGLLRTCYDLQSEQDIRYARYENDQATGISLTGTVLKVQQDFVQLQLDIDPKQDPAKACWFPIATRYVAEEHSGWYDMPEVGEQVELYLPTHREQDAYVTDSLRQQRHTNGQPNVKVWQHVQGSGVEMSEHELTLSTSGEFSITLHESNGITIDSPGNVQIQGGHVKLGAGEELSLEAGMALYLKGGASSMVLDGETDTKAPVIYQEGTVKAPVFVADLPPVPEPPLMSIKAYEAAQAPSTAKTSSSSTPTAKVTSPAAHQQASSLLGTVSKLLGSIPVMGKVAGVVAGALSGPAGGVILKATAAIPVRSKGTPTVGGSKGNGIHPLKHLAGLAMQGLISQYEHEQARHAYYSKWILGKVYTSARHIAHSGSQLELIQNLLAASKTMVHAYQQVPKSVKDRMLREYKEQEKARAEAALKAEKEARAKALKAKKEVAPPELTEEEYEKIWRDYERHIYTEDFRPKLKPGSYRGKDGLVRTSDGTPDRQYYSEWKHNYPGDFFMLTRKQGVTEEEQKWMFYAIITENPLMVGGRGGMDNTKELKGILSKLGRGKGFFNISSGVSAKVRVQELLARQQIEATENTASQKINQTLETKGYKPQPNERLTTKNQYKQQDQQARKTLRESASKAAREENSQIQKKVIYNVTKSTNARKASNIKEYLKKEKEIVTSQDNTPPRTHIVSEKSLDHANMGDFTRNPKTGEISKMSGGGHGQDNIDFLENNGIEYNIEKTYSNGVRVGNVPGHKSKGKRSGIGQAWFPKEWTKADIKNAGEHIANMAEHKETMDGIPIFGEFNGVRVGVIKTNGEIGTIFPDNMLQP